MYINKNNHIISNFLLVAAAAKIVVMAVNAISRAVFVRSDYEIAMLNSNIERVSMITSICQLLIVAIVFILFEKKIGHIKKIIPKSDYAEMALLQKEMAKDNISVLALNQIEHLLKLWGFILIAMQLIYELTTKVYEKMIMDILYLLQLSESDMSMFVSMYNGSHGFKYICMVFAIITGIFVSGLFLDDKIMMSTSFALLALFMIVFGFINSTSLHMLGREMEIVWTSVFFHAIETVGLLITSLYMRFKYKGM